MRGSKSKIKYFTAWDLAKVKVPEYPPEPEGLTWQEMVKTEPRLVKLLAQIQKADTSEVCSSQQWHMERGFKDKMKKLVGHEADGAADRLRTSTAYDLAYNALYHDAPACRCRGCTDTTRADEQTAYQKWFRGMDDIVDPVPIAFEWPAWPKAQKPWPVVTFAQKVACVASMPEGAYIAFTANLKRETFVRAIEEGYQQFVIDGKFVDVSDVDGLIYDLDKHNISVVIDKFVIGSSPSIMVDKALIKTVQDEFERDSQRQNLEALIQDGRIRTEDYFLAKTFLERRIAEALKAAYELGSLRLVCLNIKAKDASTSSATNVSTSTGPSAAQPPIPTAPRLSRLVLIRGSDVKPQELHWLWNGHLLRGSQELTTGLPGLGKSQVQCSIVACCTACLQWPDGTAALDEPVNVIMLTAEDSISQGLVPRLMAAGADMKRVRFVQCIRRDNKDRQFLLSADLLDLELAIEEVGNVGLVTIDPITAYMGGKMDSHKTTEVRSQLGPLKDLAERLDVAISTITHPAKNAGPRAIDHFIGSQAFIAAGRVGHGCFEETEINEVTGEKKPTGRNLFAHVKHSMSVKMPTLAYHLEGDVEVATGIKTSRVVWDGEVDITADAAVAGAQASKGTVRTDEQKRAADFLCEILHDGPVSQKQVEEEGEQRGFSKKVLRTTRDKIGAVSKKAGFDAGWEWSLPPAKS